MQRDRNKELEYYYKPGTMIRIPSSINKRDDMIGVVVICDGKTDYMDVRWLRADLLDRTISYHFSDSIFEKLELLR
jgi:hypothetical protein